MKLKKERTRPGALMTEESSACTPMKKGAHVHYW